MAKFFLANGALLNSGAALMLPTRPSDDDDPELTGVLDRVPKVLRFGRVAKRTRGTVPDGGPVHIKSSPGITATAVEVVDGRRHATVNDEVRVD